MLLKNAGGALPLRRDAKVYVAGRNADDIGNQAGGWTIQWQGVSGDAIPGTTILEGIREVAPRARITYSADASAPIAGADVGVVVVGETPYAEGFGDVGGPECGFCTARAAGGEVAVACSPATGRSSTRCATRSPRAWCSSSPAARRCSPTSSARSTRWSRRGCRAARAPAWPTSCSAGGPFTGRLPMTLAAQRGAGADQRRRRELPTRCSRTGSGCERRSAGLAAAHQ